jgi:hypothetical protein
MSESTTQVLALPEEFLQTALSDLKISADEIATAGKLAVLDAQPVERFDGAALQFLLAFASSKVSASPCVKNLSMPLATALKDIGVSSEYISSNFGLIVESMESAA